MKALALGIGVALAAAGAARAEEKVDVKAVGAGRALYMQHCASCHGTDGKGAGPAAASLKDPLPDLTALPAKDGRFDEARVRTSIDGTQAKTAHGSRDMPVWGKVFAKNRPQKAAEGYAQADVWTLTEYIRSIQAPAQK